MRLRSLVFLPLLFVLVLGCDDDSDSSPTTPVDVVGTLSNGTDLDDIQTHWASTGTSGPLLLISFLDDGTGRLNFGNDALFGQHSRRLLDFTWSSNATGRIRLTIALEEGGPLVVDLLNVSGGLETESMTTLIEDDEGTLFTLNLVLGSGPPPCC